MKPVKCPKRVGSFAKKNTFAILIRKMVFIFIYFLIYYYRFYFVYIFDFCEPFLVVKFTEYLCLLSIHWNSSMQQVNCGRILGTHVLPYVVTHEIYSEIALIANNFQGSCHAGTNVPTQVVSHE